MVSAARWHAGRAQGGRRWPGLDAAAARSPRRTCRWSAASWDGPLWRLTIETTSTRHHAIPARHEIDGVPVLPGDGLEGFARWRGCCCRPPRGALEEVLRAADEVLPPPGAPGDLPRAAAPRGAGHVVVELTLSSPGSCERRAGRAAPLLGKARLVRHAPAIDHHEATAPNGPARCRTTHLPHLLPRPVLPGARHVSSATTRCAASFASTCPRAGAPGPDRARAAVIEMVLQRPASTRSPRPGGWRCPRLRPADHPRHATRGRDAARRGDPAVPARRAALRRQVSDEKGRLYLELIATAPRHSHRAPEELLSPLRRAVTGGLRHARLGSAQRRNIRPGPGGAADRLPLGPERAFFERLKTPRRRREWLLAAGRRRRSAWRGCATRARVASSALTIAPTTTARRSRCCPRWADCR